VGGSNETEGEVVKLREEEGKGGHRYKRSTYGTIQKKR
jgi:hypothetical protein